jgi:hypothetical protein
MYIVCWEYSFQETDKLWFARCDYQVTPPFWLDAIEIGLTENARGGASVVYYWDENWDNDVVSVVFGYRDPDESYIQYLKFTQSFDNGLSWSDPFVLCWAAVPQGTIAESIRRPVIDVDADKTLYIAYVGYDNQVYVAKSEYDPLNPTERTFFHSNVVSNGRLHGNVYIQVDPNDNGSQQVVYDERTLEFPPNDYWKIFWTRWENDGESDYAPYDWSHEWY